MAGKTTSKTSKILPRTLPVGSTVKRKAKNGSSTPKKKKAPPKKRFYEVKFRIPAEDFTRGQPYFHEEKYLSRYVHDAFLERVNRAEANSKSARTRIMAGNMELLLPIIKEMHTQGMLDFLLTDAHGGEHGE
jgi:hypothetical protein